VRYFEAFTSNRHLKSRLGLAANILEYGVENVWQFVECLIPFFSLSFASLRFEKQTECRELLDVFD
jgi:hypothetical protein